MPRENRCQERTRGTRVEKSRVHFSRQAQYLGKLECGFSWQGEHFVQFLEIVSKIDGTSQVSEAAGAR